MKPAVRPVADEIHEQQQLHGLQPCRLAADRTVAAHQALRRRAVGEDRRGQHQQGADGEAGHGARHQRREQPVDEVNLPARRNTRWPRTLATGARAASWRGHDRHP